MASYKPPHNELFFTYSRSSGAGGQNVNKVNSKVTLRWNIENSQSLPPSMKERLLKKYAPKINAEGELVLTGQKFRNQALNVSDVMAKLREMLDSVAKAPKKRKATKPTKASKERRIKHKKEKGETKKSRSKKVALIP